MSSGGSSGSTPSSAAKNRRVVLSELLKLINGYYRAALDRFSAEGTPLLIPHLLDSGISFGLLDPVSNIITNTVSSCKPLHELNAAGQGKEDLDKSSRIGRKRKAATTEEQQDVEVAEAEEGEARRMREEAMSVITTDASNISCLPPRLNQGGASTQKRRTVAQRSLEGLVTFLICYFRNLPVTEALQYLLTAKADLLAAVHLIECTRPIGGRLCPISSPTMEIALRCAAVSASHPEPAALAARSILLASRFEKLSQILDIEGCLSFSAIDRLHKLVDEPLEQQADSPQPVLHATLRLNGYIKGTDSLNKCPFASTETLRILVLEKIHLLYLKAIAQLPKDALRSRHHRGLLKAGFCFGPADNPVSNIILNTIWYDTAFPPNEELKVDMISTNSLVRIGCRSLSGLLAFLHSLFPALTEHEAMVCLFCCNVNLQEVIFRAMQEHGTSNSYEDAYRSAAEAAWHPHPKAQAEFIMSTSPTLLPILESSQALVRAVTSKELEHISSYFLKRSVPVKPMPSVPELVPTADKIIKKNKEKFIANQYFIRRKVKAALQRYEIEKGTQYELHVICGTNFEIPENGRHGYFNNYNGFPYIHVNFLAIPKGSQPDNAAPKLFFLECSNGEEPLDIPSMFCTVLGLPTDSGRCFHCEYKGNKIVHPAFGTYRGRETDFEELACGKRRVGMEGLTLFYKQTIDFVGFSYEEDSVYFDPAVDYEFAQGMNDLVKKEEEAREHERQAIADEERLRREAPEDDDNTDMEEEEASGDDYSSPEDAEAHTDHHNTDTEEEEASEDDYSSLEDEEAQTDHNSEALEVTHTDHNSFAEKLWPE